MRFEDKKRDPAGDHNPLISLWLRDRNLNLDLQMNDLCVIGV